MSSLNEEKIKLNKKHFEYIQKIADLSKENKPNGRLTEDQIRLLCLYKRELNKIVLELSK